MSIKANQYWFVDENQQFYPVLWHMYIKSYQIMILQIGKPNFYIRKGSKVIYKYIYE